MRQMMIKVPEGMGQRVLQLAQENEGQNITFLDTVNDEQRRDLLIVNLPNRCVGDLLHALGELADMEITLIPQSVLPMGPPETEVPTVIKEVEPRSPIEIWLNALQSIGSWKSFLGYTLAGSIIVWIAMFANTGYLLVAAMLVSPFAGPAMNTAVATATGDKGMLRQSVVRYFASLAVMVAATAVLSLILNLETATTTMVNVTEVSTVAVLLPIVAGAAGALNLVQSENSSLVSGTAVGILVAASLAPPAGAIGMTAAIQRWDLAVNGVFLLLLQLVAINLSGTIVFRLYGLSTQGARFRRGHTRYFYASVLISVLALAGLLNWQFNSSPDLQRSTLSQRALPVAEQVIGEWEEVRLVEANFRFTRTRRDSSLPEALLGEIYLQRIEESPLTNEALADLIAVTIEQRLLEEEFNVTPLLNVTVLESPQFKAGN